MDHSVKLNLVINDSDIIGMIKKELKDDIKYELKEKFLKRVKGRDVVIDGLIESAIRDEVRLMIRSSDEINKFIKTAISNISVSDIVNSLEPSVFEAKIQAAINLKIDKLLSITNQKTN